MQQAAVLIQVLKAMSTGPSAIEYAKSNFGPNSPAVRIVEKTVLGTGDLGTDTDYKAAQRGFMELVRNRSLIGKIQAVSPFRRVPPRTRTLVQQSKLTAAWVGEGQLIETTGTDFEAAQLDILKISAILPYTQELLRATGAGFESSLSADLVRAVAELEGSSFIDPANAGVTKVSPPSITNGVSPIASNGVVKDDIRALLAGFTGDLETAVLVTDPDSGVALYDAGYEGAGARGGEVAGIPLVTSEAIPSDSSGTTVALIDPQGILLADEGVQLAISDQATLQVGTDSNGDPELLSLYQENLVAIRIIRLLNFEAVRPGAVTLMTGTNW